MITSLTTVTTKYGQKVVAELESKSVEWEENVSRRADDSYTAKYGVLHSRAEIRRSSFLRRDMLLFVPRQ